MRERVTAVGPHTSLADRKRRAGQRLFIGFQGHAVSDDLRALVRELRPAGFILFARNVVEPAQVRELNRELAALCDPAFPGILSVDQEGGRVQRVREPATVWPPMRAVLRAEVDPHEVGLAMGRELRAMGFHLNFAPVADVDSNPANPIIGDRSFSDRPAEVAQAILRYASGLHAAGVASCVKHFPGHGDTAQDSHLTLPTVEKELPDLEATELLPFKAAAAANLPSMMSAHVVFPAIDPERPATLSEPILRGWLRERFGFDGVLFSDDLDMKAVRGRYPIEEQVRLGSRATVDIFLACNELDTQLAVFEALVRAQEEDAAVDRASREALRRLTTLRERFLRSEGPGPALAEVGAEWHRDLALRIRARGVA